MAATLVITVLEGTAQSRWGRPQPVILTFSAVTIDTSSIRRVLAFDDHWYVGIKREPLENLRAGERVYLFREPPTPGTPTSARALIFSATTLVTPHMPRPLRLWLEGGLEVEPLFVRGGMGLSVGGRWF